MGFDDIDIIRAQLSKTLDALPEAASYGKFFRGKVRDNYVTQNGRRIMVASDRISAFDVVLGTIPFKGQVLNQMAAYWFEETRSIAPNHVLSIPDPAVTVAKECKPLSAEFIMRGYLTGSTSTSIWSAYEKGSRTFCGHALPDGMKKHQKLPKALLTPSTKAEQGDHDESVSAEELVRRGHISKADFDEAAELCEKLFAFGQKLAASRGLILVDTKYEIGRDAEGNLVFIDEIHTPDSSRYWYADDYEARLAKGEDPRPLDKEYVRTYLSKELGYRGDGPAPKLPDAVRIEAAKRYIATYEQVTGKAFVPNTEEPAARIARNLEAVV